MSLSVGGTPDRHTAWSAFKKDADQNTPSLSRADTCFRAYLCWALLMVQMGVF